MCASDAILWNAYRSFLARGGCSLKVVGWSFCNTSAEPAFSIHSFNSYWFVVFQSAGPLLNSVWMRLLQLCVSIYDSAEAQSQASSLESGRAELFHHKGTKSAEQMPSIRRICAIRSLLLCDVVSKQVLTSALKTLRFVPCLISWIMRWVISDSPRAAAS